MMSRVCIVAGVLVSSSLLLVGAASGQTLLTQGKANNGLGGCDAPGFPITICKSGSYRLTGNLTVPNSDTDGIVIAASHVTIDLNGFAILGPVDCSGNLNPCAGDVGHGVGIVTQNVHFNITIRNGTVQGMGSHGVELHGDSNLVEYLHVRSNGEVGVGLRQSQDAASSIVQYITALRNAGTGISLERGLVRHSVSDVNGSAGISLVRGSASFNVITRNPTGMVLGSNASYMGNTLSENKAHVAGGVNLGQNLCGGSICPGAQF